MFIAVLARRLRPGATVEVADGREILTVGFVDLPRREALAAAMERVAEQEAARHDRIEAVIECSRVHAIYEVLAEYDFSTDESVERGRPPGTGGA
jgi:hypothetical protein